MLTIKQYQKHDNVSYGQCFLLLLYYFYKNDGFMSICTYVHTYFVTHKMIFKYVYTRKMLSYFV